MSRGQGRPLARGARSLLFGGLHLEDVEVGVREILQLVLSHGDKGGHSGSGGLVHAARIQEIRFFC